MEVIFIDNLNSSNNVSNNTNTQGAHIVPQKHPLQKTINSPASSTIYKISPFSKSEVSISNINQEEQKSLEEIS